jgi:pimeloyl-ACP methyl ester carboxylesterase
VVVGNSIGTGPATEIAATTRVAALVLISPFTALADVASAKLRWFPAGRLVRDRYENLQKIPRVDAPVLILHGSRDRLIPIAHAEALAAAAPGAELVRFPGFGHELAWRQQTGVAAARWLQRTLPLR